MQSDKLGACLINLTVSTLRTVNEALDLGRTGELHGPHKSRNLHTTPCYIFRLLSFL